MDLVSRIEEAVNNDDAPALYSIAGGIEEKEYALSVMRMAQRIEEGEWAYDRKVDEYGR